MKIIITGHNGFVGKALARFLSDKNFEVIGISRSSGYDLEEYSVCDKLPRADMVIHLAGRVGVSDSWENPESHYRINYLSTLTMVEYSRKNKVPLVFLSSYMYGMPDYLPIDESHAVKCNNPYAYSKKMAEDLIIYYNNLYNLNAVILRPMNLYGSGMTEDNVMMYLLRQAREGNLIKIRDLSPKRDYLNVEDLCVAFWKVITSEIKGLSIYNLGYGKSYSVLELIKEMELLLNKNLRIDESGEKRVNEIEDCYSNNQKFSIKYNWNPVKSLRDGIAEIIKSS